MQYEIKYLAISDLKVNPGNPRFIRDAAFKKLVKSLSDCPSLFDARPCICSNRTGENIIIGGNMRFRAAVELKYKKVPTIIMEGLTELEEKEITIKDNATAFGEWDMDMLSGWGDLPLAEWGVVVPVIDDSLGDMPGEGSGKSETETIFCPKCGHEFEKK